MIYHIGLDKEESDWIALDPDHLILNDLVLDDQTIIFAHGLASYPVLKHLETAEFNMIHALVLVNPVDEIDEAHPFYGYWDSIRVQYENIIGRVILRGLVAKSHDKAARQVGIRLNATMLSVDPLHWIGLQSGWVDSHAHLVSDSMYEDIDEIPQDLRVNVICGSLKEVERGLLLDDRFDLSIGIHPTSVQEFDDETLLAMMSYLRHPKVVAVGEIGLDYYWDESYKELQKQRLIQQIEWANRSSLPIVVHVRESIEDVYEILSSHHVLMKGVIHCFTYGSEWALKFVELGYFIGVGGIVTFKNGDNVKEMVDKIPLDRLLLETDSPYLAPVPMRGKPNKAQYVAYTASFVAGLLGLDEAQLMHMNLVNYKTLFRKS